MIHAREIDKPKENRLAEYLPWSLLSAPGVVEHKDGSLQKTFKFQGPDLKSANTRKLMTVSAAFNNAMRRLGKGWAIHIEAQRNSIEEYPKIKWPNEACQKIDDERREQFSHKETFFANDYYLTFVFSNFKVINEKSFSWFFKQDLRDKQQCSLEDFQNSITQVQGILSSVFSMLTPLNDDETLTYLHSTVSSHRFNLKTPDVPMYLDSLLCDEELEHGMGMKLGDNFVKILTINGFPCESFPGILDALNDLNFPFRWSTRFICFGHEGGKKNLENIRRLWFSGRKKLMTILQEVASQSESSLGESGAMNNSEDADAALQILDSGHVSFGQFTATICLWDLQAKRAHDKAQKALSIINRLGFSALIEKLNSFEAWLSSLPGNRYANVRKPIIHSLNLAHMAPLSSVWVGEKNNTHLKAPAHFYGKCRNNTPFRFSSNVGDVGHTLIFGPTGAGKSTLLSFMAAQWMKYKDAQVFFFDKGYSSRVLTKCVGGAFFVVGEKSQKPCFQPLKNIHDESEKIWASSWLLDILQEQGCPIDTDIKTEVWEGLNNLSQQEPQSRTISVLQSLIQEPSIKSALSHFTLSGPYGELFDASQEEVCNNCWQSFEIAELLEKKGACQATLSYLFHRLEERFDGSPTLLILDEAWLFLENSTFAKKIKEWLKQLRKSNVYVIFATQSLSDAMQSPISMALKESCPTKIFLPNSSAEDEVSRKFYEGMGLSDRQIEIIAQAIPKKEYYLQSLKGNRLFDLDLGPVALALCASSSVNHQKWLNDIEQENSHEKLTQAFLNKIAKVNNGLLH